MGILSRLFGEKDLKPKQRITLDSKNVYDICYAMAFIAATDCYIWRNSIYLNILENSVTISGTIDSDNCETARNANNLACLRGMKNAAVRNPEVACLMSSIPYHFQNGSLCLEQKLAINNFCPDEQRLHRTIATAVSDCGCNTRYKIGVHQNNSFVCVDFGDI